MITLARWAPSEAAQMVQAYADRVEHPTDELIAAIEGASYPQAKHVLTRALGALIGSTPKTMPIAKLLFPLPPGPLQAVPGVRPS